MFNIECMSVNVTGILIKRPIKLQQHVACEHEQFSHFILILMFLE